MDGPPAPNGAPGPMNGRGGPPPSPPVSIARSSSGNGLYPDGGPPGPGVPPGGPPGGRKYNMQALEAQLVDHHQVLKDYLAESLRQDKSYMPHNRARDKLLKLSPIQFQELSTDVYDELLRREDDRVAQGPEGNGRNIPRFLLPKNNYHPKRNQARQKLSTLPPKKFRELATDVLFELERRFPRFTGAERVANRGHSRPPTGQGFHSMRRPSNASSIGGPYSPSVVDGRATPGSRQFQSNTMVPNKGTLIEDDDASADGDDPFDYARRSSKRTTNRSLPYSVRGPDPGLEARIEELESQLAQKDRSLEEERDRSSSLNSTLEKQLNNAKGLNGSLQAEIDRMRADREAEDWKDRYESLEHEFEEYRHATESIQRETAESMQEVRSLTQRIDGRRPVEEKLAKQNAQLQDEIETWKDRHAKTRAHLRTLKASSTSLYIQQPTAAQFLHEQSVLDPRGAVRDISVSRFQQAVDEVLRLARDGEPSDVLTYMQQLVACVRGITNDVSKADPRGPDEFVKRRTKLELRIAATTNNVITVCKNHAVANGLAPVALVDAAASHLSSSVVDYIKFMKVKPSPEEDLDEHDGYA